MYNQSWRGVPPHSTLVTRHSTLSRFDFFGAVSYSYLDSSLIPAKRGAVAQLGERLNGIQEVVGSIPIGSTNKSITWTPLKFSPSANCVRTVSVLGFCCSFHCRFGGYD